MEGIRFLELDFFILEFFFEKKNGRMIYEDQ
jgi:hypothetical protein